MPLLNRNRLLNATVFFAENVKSCGKIKLFKLLYLADFEHFRLTGKSITGVEYQAWKFGPVPIELMEEWDAMDEDFAHAVHIEHEKIYDHTRQTVVVNEGVAFDDVEFTRRQIGILEALARRFHETNSEELIDITHEQNGAWDKVWRNGAGNRQVIPYDLALPDNMPEREAVLAVAHEQEMFQAAIATFRKTADAA